MPCATPVEFCREVPEGGAVGKVSDREDAGVPRVALETSEGVSAMSAGFLESPELSGKLLESVNRAGKPGEPLDVVGAESRTSSIGKGSLE